MTRLLKTPIIGRTAAAVASSCNDTLAGLSQCEMLRVRPGFCAEAVVQGDRAHSAGSNELAIASPRRRRLISVPPSSHGRVIACCGGALFYRPGACNPEVSTSNSSRDKRSPGLGLPRAGPFLNECSGDAAART